MHMKQLHYFYRLAQLEHVRKTADSFNIKPSFLSKKIGELEAELGAALFERKGRKIILNDCGKIYYRYVETVLSDLNRAKEELDHYLETASRRVILASNANLYIPHLLSSFHDSHPEIELKYIIERRHEIFNLLINGGADYAIITPTVDENSLFDVTHILNEQLFIVYPPDHPFAKRDRISARDLVDEPIIGATVGYGIRDSFDHAFHQTGHELHYIIETTETSAIPHFVKVGSGIGYQAYSIIKNDPVLLANHKPLEGLPLTTVVDLVRVASKTETPIMKRVKEHIIEYFESI